MKDTEVLNTHDVQDVYATKRWIGTCPECDTLPKKDHDLVNKEYVDSAGGGYTEGCRVFNSVNLPIPNVAWTNLTFDSERYDTDGIHSIMANTDRLTCQTAGIYLITGHVAWNIAAGGIRRIAVYLNAATNLCHDLSPTIAGWNEINNVATVYSLSIGDFVVLRAYQSSGGPINVLNIANMSPEFSMQRIG